MENLSAKLALMPQIENRIYKKELGSEKEKLLSKGLDAERKGYASLISRIRLFFCEDQATELS